MTEEDQFDKHNKLWLDTMYGKPYEAMYFADLEENVLLKIDTKVIKNPGGPIFLLRPEKGVVFGLEYCAYMSGDITFSDHGESIIPVTDGFSWKVGWYSSEIKQAKKNKKKLKVGSVYNISSVDYVMPTGAIDYTPWITWPNHNNLMYSVGDGPQEEFFHTVENLTYLGVGKVQLNLRGDPNPVDVYRFKCRQGTIHNFRQDLMTRVELTRIK